MVGGIIKGILLRLYIRLQLMYIWLTLVLYEPYQSNKDNVRSFNWWKAPRFESSVVLGAVAAPGSAMNKYQRVNHTKRDLFR